MSWLRSIVGRLSALFRKGRLDADLDDELRFHLEMEEQENIRNGMSAKEARRQARLRLGGMEQVKEEYRDHRGIPFLESLLQDLRFAFRSFRRDPGFTATVLVTLALGIGVGTAIFAVVNAVLLQPLPYDDPDRLVFLRRVNDREDVRSDGVNIYDCYDWRERSGLFESVVCAWPDGISLDGKSYATLSVDEGFCEGVGVRPILGRCFVPDDFRPTGPAKLILQYDVWQSQFGGDPRIIGQTFSNDLDRGVSVIGVMPPGFTFFSRSTQGFRPLIFLNPNHRDRRSDFPDRQAVGRVKTGLTLEQTQARADVFSRQLAEAHPETNRGWRFLLSPVSDEASKGLRSPLFLLLSASTLVLLVVCLNVAGLVLIRSRTRSTELAVRSALGAGRRRLIRQLLTENIMLSVAGGLIGLGLACLLVDYLRLWIPSTRWADRILGVENIGIDPWVIYFVVGVALSSGVIFGLLPAFQGTSTRLVAWIKQDSRGALGGSRAGQWLSVAQIALAVVLTVSACLLVRSFSILNGQGPGFRAENLVSLGIGPSGLVYGPGRPGRTLPAEERLRIFEQFWRTLREELQGVPGVTAFSFASHVPMLFPRQADAFYSPEGKESDPKGGHVAVFAWADTEYFNLLGIPLIGGRVFDGQDLRGAIPVAVLSKEAARRLWPGESPIGRKLYRERRGIREAGSLTVVGVVGDVQDEGLGKTSLPVVYEAAAQVPWPSGSVLIRTTGSNDRLAADVAARLHDLYPETRLYDGSYQTLDYLARDSIWQLNYSMLLLTGLAGLALLVSAVGVYGVLSYTVRQRTREIGLRMALGAAPSEMLRMVLRQGFSMAATGIVIGIIAAAGLTRFLGSLLYGVEPLDGPTFALVAVVMMAAALLASYLPARQAAKLNPTAALHCD